MRFQYFKAITYLARNICEGIITLDDADKDLLFMIYYLKLVISINLRNQELLVRKKKKGIFLIA